MCFLDKFLMSVALADETAASTATTAATDTATATTEASTLSSTLSMIIPLVLMVAVFYFLLIRPQKKKEKKVKDMLDALKPGDRICTIGGIYGTITSLKDDTVELCVGRDDVKMVIARWAIRNVEDVKIENDTEVLN